MREKERYLAVILLALAVVVVTLWLATQSSLESTLFATYTSEAVDFQHPDDAVPIVLPPTPESIPIYDIRIKSYDFDDYQENLSWENGQRWNPDFNDVILLVWKTDGSLRMKAIGSPSTFRNELWGVGRAYFDNVEAYLKIDFESSIPTRLR
ncbi:MAG: hypothetical protein QMD00_03525 [Hadesarchaea archaeon]|nr:hypothetical protein [Hadesarchaea archaeon]